MKSKFGLSHHFLSILIFLFCLMIPFTGHLSAAIIIVPPGGSIQTAINSANDGDTVQISAGTYIEEVQVISKSIDIVGAGINATIIQSPPAATHLTQNFSFGGVTWWCVLMVNNTAAPTPQTVNISNLTVDGSDQQDALGPIYGSSNRFFAIGYHNANGTVQNVHTTNTKQTVNFNELAGGGILNASDVGIVTFNVMNCLVDFYQRIGIDCRGTALMAQVSSNTVNRAFILPPGTATPNGIQFSGGVVGSITNNLTEGNIAGSPNAAGSGIILSSPGANVIVSGNTVTNNDAGIAALTCNHLLISNNHLNFTTPPGINGAEGIFVLEPTGLTTIISNVMNQIPNINMDLESSTDQPFQLMNNQFIGSQTGLLVVGNGPTGPVVTMDHDSFTGTSGFYIQESAAPNDIWPSTATVSFDGLISGHMTMAEFNQVLTKIFDKHNDPLLGLVLAFIPPSLPNVTSVNPSLGPESGGTPILIMGSNFISSHTEVFFGSTPALNVTVVSDNLIMATSPPGVGSVHVIVITSIGISPETPSDEFTYIPMPPANPPIVTNVIPNFGSPSGGNTINIIGSGFISSDTRVFFDTNRALSVVVISDTLIEVTVPSGTGVVNVFVVTPNGVSKPNPRTIYSYIPPTPQPPLPPAHFIGFITGHKKFVLHAMWTPSPSPNVVQYRIFKGKKLIAKIAATAPLRFTKRSFFKRSFKKYTIVAVSADNLSSDPVQITIKHIKHIKRRHSHSSSSSSSSSSDVIPVHFFRLDAAL